MNPSNVKRAINWIFDLHNPEMIEATNYTRTYLGFNTISQKELDDLTTLLNIILVTSINKTDIIRIDNSMGEIIVIRSKILGKLK